MNKGEALNKAVKLVGCKDEVGIAMNRFGNYIVVIDNRVRPTYKMVQVLATRKARHFGVYNEDGTREFRYMNFVVTETNRQKASSTYCISSRDGEVHGAICGQSDDDVLRMIDEVYSNEVYG